METQKCVYCESKEVIKRGLRKTKNRGSIQRYYCKNCKKRYTEKDAFFRMRNTPHKITMCLDMYFRGMSLRKIQEHLQAFYPHNSSHQTILNWIRKYCIMIGNYTDNLQIKTSTQISLDEMEYKTKGKTSWFIDVIDMETRYMLSSGYFYARSLKELKQVLYKVKRNSTNAPELVHTDGLPSYPRLLQAVYRNKRIKHYAVLSSSKEFNWKIERLHGNIRERTKTMRFFKSLNSAKAIMKGFEIFYNFCRKHQGIRKYPYELATDLQLGKNKWLDLIRLASE